jgi:hypothetical protein
MLSTTINYLEKIRINKPFLKGFTQKTFYRLTVDVVSFQPPKSSQKFTQNFFLKKRAMPTQWRLYPKPQ